MTQASPTPEEIWRTRLAAWRASGQSVEQFAKAQGVSATTVRKWKKRVSDADAAPAQLVRLVPRATPAPTLPRSASALTIEVGGARLTVTDETDDVLLLRVVRVLRGVS